MVLAAKNWILFLFLYILDKFWLKYTKKYQQQTPLKASSILGDGEATLKRLRFKIYFLCY